MNFNLKKLLVVALLTTSIAHASSTSTSSQAKGHYKRTWSEGQLFSGSVFAGLTYGLWKLGEFNAKFYEKNSRDMNMFFMNVCNMYALGCGAIAASILYWAIKGDKVWVAAKEQGTTDGYYKRSSRSSVKKKKSH